MTRLWQKEICCGKIKVNYRIKSPNYAFLRRLIMHDDIHIILDSNSNDQDTNIINEPHNNE